MALRQILLPWDAQPAERVPPDAGVAGWGTMVVASSWPVELVNQAPIAQLNGTYQTRVVPSRVGPAIAPVSGSGVAAATWMPAPDMGAIIGASLLWHGVITAASGSSTTTGLFGRYSTTSGGAGYVGQFFLRVTTAGKIQLEVNSGAGPVAYTTGLTVVYGEPLTILIRFTAAGADILSTVGAESVSISGMASAVGIYTPGIFASIGADRWNYTGHPYQQTALAAWARTHIPPQCVREPWSVLELQRLIVASGTPAGDATVTLQGVSAAPGVGALAATGGAFGLLAGVAADAAVGAIAATGGAAVALAGMAAAPIVGAISASAGATAALQGVAASPAVGQLAAVAGATATLQGVAASPAVGQVTVQAAGSSSITVQGVAAAPAVGQLTASGGASITMGSVAAAPGVGQVDVLAGGAVAVTLPGVAASPAAGQITATGGAQILLAGLRALPAVGQVTAVGDAVSALPPAERTLAIGREDRALRILAEARAVAIQHEDRTLRISPP